MSLNLMCICAQCVCLVMWFLAALEEELKQKQAQAEASKS